MPRHICAFNDLDQELVDDFLQRPIPQDKLRQAGVRRATYNEHFGHIGLSVDGNLTRAAMLCFAPRAKLVGRESACMLSVSVFDDTEVNSEQLIFREEYEDNLLNLFEIGMRFFRQDARLRRTGAVGTTQRDDLEIPEIALREALANALAHREYAEQDARLQPITINVFSDQIEIINPGKLHVDVQKINDFDVQVPQRRKNAIIARIFYYMTYVELAGSGIRRMHTEANKRQLPLPRYVQEDSEPPFVKVIFNRPTQTSGLSRIAENIPPNTSVSSVYGSGPGHGSPKGGVTKPQVKTHRDVVISSTSTDLKDHRDMVKDAVWRAGMFPRTIEQLGAMPIDAVAYSLDLVDKAEVYVGIFGYRYGFMPTDKQINPNGVSITELEYRRALERDIPVLIFMMHDEHPLTPTQMERNPVALQKLRGCLKINVGV